MWKAAINNRVKQRILRIPNPDKERIKQAIRDLERGEFLTLEELIEGL